MRVRVAVTLAKLATVLLQAVIFVLCWWYILLERIDTDMVEFYREA